MEIEADDSGPSQHWLQFFHGRSFNRVKYTEEEFRTPYDSCWFCTKRITPYPESDRMVDTGYVTLTSIDVPGHPEWLQWDWVCEECFGSFQEKANWTALEGAVDAETHRRFSEHVEETLRRREIEDPPPAGGYDLQATWTAQDVVWIAAARGLELEHDKASAMLWRYRRRLVAAMDSAAYDGIGKMLERCMKKPQC
jgi:hypothetical protein